MNPRRVMLVAGVLAAFAIPLGTVSVARVSNPSTFSRVTSLVSSDVQQWAKVAWEVLREGRSMPVMLIDAIARVVPQATAVPGEARALLDDGGDVLLLPELRGGGGEQPVNAPMPGGLEILPDLRVVPPAVSPGLIPLDEESVRTPVRTLRPGTAARVLGKPGRSNGASRVVG